jgi:hypothetical protein
MLSPEGEVHVLIPEPGSDHSLFEVDDLVVSNLRCPRGNNLGNDLALDDNVHEIPGR